MKGCENTWLENLTENRFKEFLVKDLKLGGKNNHITSIKIVDDKYVGKTIVVTYVTKIEGKEVEKSYIFDNVFVSNQDGCIYPFNNRTGNLIKNETTKWFYLLKEVNEGKKIYGKTYNRYFEYHTRFSLSEQKHKEINQIITRYNKLFSKLDELTQNKMEL